MAAMTGELKMRAETDRAAAMRESDEMLRLLKLAAIGAAFHSDGTVRAEWLKDVRALVATIDRGETRLAATDGRDPTTLTAESRAAQRGSRG